MTGRRRPAHLKLLAGTYRRDRDPGSATAPRDRKCAQEARIPHAKGRGRTPPPPSWLPSCLRPRWVRYCRLLIAERRATEGTLDMLAQYLALDRALADAWQRGDLPKNSHLSRHWLLANRLGLVSAAKSNPDAGPECAPPREKPEPATPNRFASNKAFSLRKLR
jgi:hypothetical protein